MKMALTVRNIIIVIKSQYPYSFDKVRILKFSRNQESYIESNFNFDQQK